MKNLATKRSQNAEIQKIKAEMMLREEKKYEKYMDNVIKEEIIERREDRFSPTFMNKLAEMSGDTELMQKVNTHLDKRQENFLMDKIVKTQRFRRDMRLGSKTWAYFKHGKLGIDAFMIMFAVVGVGLIPWYFINKQQKMKKRMEAQGLKPISVHDLDPYGEIDLDDVSVHTTYYDTDAIKRRLAKKNKIMKEKE